MNRMWDYRDSGWTEGHDLDGYDVEATDGSIGNIDGATNESPTSTSSSTPGSGSSGRSG